MRLRDLTPTETAAVEARRDAVREALERIDAPWTPTADMIDKAPFLDDFEARGDGLHGLCWGHPVQGDVFITTTPIVQSGDGWALTQNTLYILGGARPKAQERLDKILSGRRGRGRPVIAFDPDPEDEAAPGPRIP
ncbi:hypothetical protein [Methylobacterium sp. Leaf112]|uniref:hypothetical protein n=1 Tax=Methylobacterium sp. Leaf112 TaxID=1736258 RepID=UPI0006FF7CDC|nr:hypothetical protein [Methylobacterium sp. Leaf112]KQP62167.1 hypothetical protein ASF52_05780 [Methylobacterium sp. Leaf112]